MGCDIETVKEARMRVARRFFPSLRDSLDRGAAVRAREEGGLLPPVGTEGEFYEGSAQRDGAGHEEL